MDIKFRDKYNSLKVKHLELCRKSEEIREEISEVLIEIARIEIYPFVEGQDVKCVVPAGRTKKEVLCRIEIDNTGTVWVRPYKPNGVLGERRFKAWVGEDKDYKKIFKEANR